MPYSRRNYDFKMTQKLQSDEYKLELKEKR